MPFIPYRPEQELAPEERVPDPDNIIQIHRVSPRLMRRHHDLYGELMRGEGPLTPRRRETVALVVSALNGCRY